MSNQRIASIVGEAITFATGNLVRAVNIPGGAEGVEVRVTTTATNYWQFCPRLRKAFKFTAVGAVYRDDTAALSDRGDGTTATYNSMVATNDFLYVGCDVPFRGVYVNVANANGTASVLSAFYWDGTTWTGLTETDGTTSGGAALAIDNAITWTVPSDWTKTSVNNSSQFFWVRMNTDGGTDSATSLAEVIPLSIQPASVVGAQGVVAITSAVAPPRYWFSPDKVGGIEMIAADTNVVRTEFLCTQQASSLVAQ